MVNANMFTKTNKVITVIKDVPLAVASTGTAYSESFELPKTSDQNTALSIQCAVTSGTPNIKVEFEQSNTALTTAEEGSANANYVLPVDVGTIITLTATAKKILTFNVDSTIYGRFKFTGLGSNPASATISLCELSVVGG